MHLPKGIVKATGVSRTDFFYDSEFVESRRQKLYEIMPEAKDKKVILYAPTFRGHVATAKSPDKIDFERFYQELGDEYVIVCKHHPFVKKTTGNSRRITAFCKRFNERPFYRRFTL